MGLRFWRRRRSRPDTTIAVRIGTPNLVPARHNLIRREAELLELQSKNGVENAEALVASGQLITHGQASYLRRLIQPWQIRAFGYYDLLGEIKYAAQFYSRALQNLRLFAAEINDEGELVPTEDEEVKAALARIKDPGGTSQRGLLGDYGRLIFLVGEALLFVWWNPATELEQWEMLSTDELRALDGSYTRFSAPSLPATNFMPAPDDAYIPIPDPEPGKQQAVAYRLWKRHPRFSALPDSPMEGVLELCEELVLLTHAVRARARSRLAGSGILFIDDRITTRPMEATPDEDFQEDPFLEDMTESMTAPIIDEGTASAVVPLLARVKVPDGMKLSDLVYHLQVVDPTQLYPETGLRMECVRRIAICLDMPAEMLLGLGTLNHWNVWGIDEQSWKYHLQPIADHLVADLTSAYLGPYLKNVLHRDDWTKFAVDYDASRVINHPDRSKDAKDLHDRAVIGDAALRDATGFTEDDKPTEEELARIIGMKINDGSLAWYGEPAPRGGTVEVAPGIINQAGQTSAPGGPAAGAEAEKGPPPGGPPSGNEGLTASVLLSGAAGLGVLRAREVAGSRLRTLARRDPDTAETLKPIKNSDVAATLGRDKTRALGGAEADLVAGARSLIVDGFQLHGVQEDVAQELALVVEAHAVRTLYMTRFPLLPESFDTFVQQLLQKT